MIAIAIIGAIYTIILPMTQSKTIQVKAQEVNITSLGDNMIHVSATLNNTGDVTIEKVNADILEIPDGPEITKSNLAFEPDETEIYSQNLKFSKPEDNSMTIKFQFESKNGNTSNLTKDVVVKFRLPIN